MPPVSDVALTDLDTLKSYLAIKSTDTASDTFLSFLIEPASSIIKRAMNRPILIESTITDELYRGSGNYRLFLKTQPVISVASLSYPSSVIAPYSTTSAPYGYRVDQYGIELLGSFFSTSEYYTVTYTAGFALDSKEAEMAEVAVLALCNLWWKRKPHTDEAARSMGQQVTAKFIQDEFPPEARAIVNLLKRVV